MSEESNGPDGNTAASLFSLTAQAITNYQLLPDNGGYTLLLGVRNLVVNDQSFGTFPDLKVTPVCAAFLSNAILKDLHRVLGTAIADYERVWGPIALPGVDKPHDQPTDKASER